MIRTKIICTIGPSVNTSKKMMELMEAGMNVARINFSHGTREQHKLMIRKLQEARKKMNQPLAIMLDTKGPEIRLGKIKDGELTLREGDKWLLTKADLLGDRHRVSVNPPEILEALPLDVRVLFNDGAIACRVVETTKAGVVVRIEDGGVITSGKGVNIPDLRFDFPPLTDRDMEDIRFGVNLGIDLIAASFIRTPENVIAVKNLLAAEKASDVLVIAKIETREGLQNFDSILQVADGVMIARGDLGVQVELSSVPRLQKEMIRKCYLAGKPSITATQMLESMIVHPRPTRAEVSDVANAIYDSTSAVMLSGETAVGRFPIETVKIMRSIIEETEAYFDYQNFFKTYSGQVFNDVPSAVALASVKTAYSSDARALFVFTSRGITAFALSRLRPSMPILAMTSSEKCYHQMALQWGVIPVLEKKIRTVRESFLKLSTFALKHDLVSYGDLVINLTGSIFGVTGTTNMMVVENIGEVLVRGHSGYGERVYGNITHLASPDIIKPYMVRGRLLVIPNYDDAFAPFVRESIGVILHNHISDNASEEKLLSFAKEAQKPILVRADDARRILKEGQLVTLDPSKALVYKGVVMEKGEKKKAKKDTSSKKLGKTVI